MLIFRLIILRSCRVDDRRKGRLTTDKSDLTRNKCFLNKLQKGKGQGPVVEISGSGAVGAVGAE